MILPTIETNNYQGQLEETPYRLPSRLKRNFRKSAISRSSTAKSSKRSYLYSRRANTSLSKNFLFPDEQVLKPQSAFIPNYCQMDDGLNVLGSSNNARLSREHNKQSFFSRLTLNQTDRKSTESHQTTEKMIWISELNAWLTENMVNHDFVKLSKLATIHDNELWKEIKFMRKMKETILTSHHNFEKENDYIYKGKEKTLPNLHTIIKEKPKKPSSRKEMNLSDIKNSNKNIQISIVNKRNSENKNNIVETGNAKEGFENPIKAINKSSKTSLVNHTDTQKTIEPSSETIKTITFEKYEPSTERSFQTFIGNKSIPDPIEGSSILNILNQELLKDNECNLDIQTQNKEDEESFLEKIKLTTVENIPYENAEMSADLQNAFIEVDVSLTSQSNADPTNLQLMNKTLRRDSQLKRKGKDLQISLGMQQTLKTETGNESEELSDTSDLLDDNYNGEIEEENITILSHEINTKLDLPSLPEVLEVSDTDQQSNKHNESKSELATVIKNKLIPLLKLQKQRWGAKKRDLSLIKDLENEQRAEQRKLKIKKLIEKIKLKKAVDSKPIISDAPRFETYGFLAKYCILKKINVSLYHDTFDVCDEDKKLWLNEKELKMALKGVNLNLKDYDIEYLNLVMKLCDYNLQSGADFKLFAVLAALSIQITTLDSWIKNKLGKADFKTLEKKVFLGRKLWEVNVDPSSNTIPFSALMVELKAGGVKQKNIEEINQRLGWMKELNFLDFLTYIPLFILLHISIIDNPLDMAEKL